MPFDQQTTCGVWFSIGLLLSWLQPLWASCSWWIQLCWAWSMCGVSLTRKRLSHSGSVPNSKQSTCHGFYSVSMCSSMAVDLMRFWESLLVICRCSLLNLSIKFHMSTKKPCNSNLVTLIYRYYFAAFQYAQDHGGEPLIKTPRFLEGFLPPYQNSRATAGFTYIPPTNRETDSQTTNRSSSFFSGHRWGQGRSLRDWDDRR